eukprot:6201447-Pleurochrysis_carterae.AAC.2
MEAIGAGFVLVGLFNDRRTRSLLIGGTGALFARLACVGMRRTSFGRIAATQRLSEKEARLHALRWRSGAQQLECSVQVGVASRHTKRLSCVLA